MKKMDSRGAIYAVLPRLQFTSGVPDTKYELLLRLFRFRERVYQKDAMIFMSGTSAAVFGALVAGRVQSTSFDFLGNKKIIAEYHAWECFAVTNVSCSIGEYAFDYVAAEPSRVLLFDITEIFQPTAAFAMSDRLLAAERMHNESVRQSQRYERHITAMCGRTLREKLMAFLADRIRENGSHEFSIDFSRQELADYLGVNRSSLCRELSILKEQGLLKCSGKKFHIIMDHDYMMD